jgi:hypothetical protein
MMPLGRPHQQLPKIRWISRQAPLVEKRTGAFVFLTRGNPQLHAAVAAESSTSPAVSWSSEKPTWYECTEFKIEILEKTV